MKDIIQNYKMILTGILNYYAFANNRPKLRIIHWILKKSLAKTIATKLNLKSVRKVYLKLGPNISYKTPGTNKIIDFRVPDLSPNLKDFKGETVLKDELRVVEWKLRSVDLFNRVCASCGSEEEIQIHHVKHIKTINPKLDSMGKQMASINRKQIPLCSNCHRLVHQGKYDGPGLKYINVKKGEGGTIKEQEK